MKYLKSFESKKEKLYRQVSDKDFNDAFSNRPFEDFSIKEIKIIKETIYRLYRENVEAEINVFEDFIKIDIDVNNQMIYFILYIYKRHDEYFYIKKVHTYSSSRPINYECDTLDGVIEYFNSGVHLRINI